MNALRRLTGLIGIPASIMTALSLLLVILLVLGIQMTGGINEFSRWLKDAYWELLLWRSMLYGTIGYLWFSRVRNRLLLVIDRDEDGGIEGQKRLRRQEMLFLIVILITELHNFHTDG